MIVDDITLRTPFRIKDVDIGHYVYSVLDGTVPAVLPEDIANLHVVGVMIDRETGYMEVETGE